jgi:gamma-glutamyltranspeptidase/glutathione hydrolase
MQPINKILVSLVTVSSLAWNGPSCAYAREPVRAAHAMVVTVEPHATEVGVAVLKSGGNAIDAAVAVGFALAVTHPSAGNLGGGGFMLIRFADGRTTFIDFRERAPAKATPGMYLGKNGEPGDQSDIGYLASGVPGTVRGFELAQRKYGSRTWAELLQPAWLLAAKGFVVSPGLVRQLKQRENQDRLSRFPESRRIFLRNGRPFATGEVFRQSDLAGTLKRLMKRGAADFYEGETARLIATDMKAHDGLISLDDLRQYKAVERSPLTGSYRGYTIITAPPPSSGGFGILQILGMLEPTGFASNGPDSPKAVHFMAEAMRRYFADRSRYLGDPDFCATPDFLLNSEYISARRRTIDPDRASPSEAIAAGAAEQPESRQTTHYSIIDAAGNAVAVTYTLNGSYGSGVTVPGTGFLLNNEMDDFSRKPGTANQGALSYNGDANSIQPHKIPLSSMSPTIVLHEGKVYAILGSPGGPTIINTVLEVLINLIDFKMNIADAVDAPRFHHQWKPDRLQIEQAFPPGTVAWLRAMGHKVEVVREQGEVAAILANGGWLEGAADPRTEGTAEGL